MGLHRQDQDAAGAVVAEKRGKLKLGRGACLHQAQEEPFRQVAVGRACELAFQPHDPPRETRGARGLWKRARFIGSRSPHDVEGDAPRGVYLNPQVLAALDVEGPPHSRRKRHHEGLPLTVQAPEEHPGTLFGSPQGTGSLVEGSTAVLHAVQFTPGAPAGGGQVVLDDADRTRVGSAVMATTTLSLRRKDPHAVALGRRGKNRAPLSIYGDLTVAQKREHYSWMRRTALARAAGMPAPQAPPWVRMRAMLHRYGFNERAARIREADRTAELGYQGIVEFLDHLPASLQTPIRANLAVIARAMLKLVLLAGVDEPDETEIRRGLYSALPGRG